MPRSLLTSVPAPGRLGMRCTGLARRLRGETCFASVPTLAPVCSSLSVDETPKSALATAYISKHESLLDPITAGQGICRKVC
jgi:hypothetical protein